MIQPRPRSRFCKFTLVGQRRVSCHLLNVSRPRGSGKTSVLYPDYPTCCGNDAQRNGNKV